MSKTGFKKGRLGIGTDNPRYPLDVVGDIRLTGGFRDASGNDFNFLAINNVDYIKQEDINGITSSNSKIGILNTNPSEELDVSGNINFTGTLKQNGVAFGGGKFQDAATSGDIYYNDGNVGIGTTSTDGKLHIVGSSGVHALRITGNSANNAQIYATGSNYGIRIVTAASSGSYYSAYFEGSSGKGLYVRDDGNVGIGTTDPDARLHVEVPGFGEPIAKFSGVGDSFILIEGGRTNDWDETGVVIKGMPTGGYWLAGVDDSSTYQIKYDTDFHFGNEGIGLAIKTDGNVGIGTDNPGQKLEVKTGISFDGIILNNEDGGLLFKAARSSAKARAYFGLYDGTTSAPQGKVVFRNDDDSYINTGGNVGIGTTDPGNFKLKIYNSTGTNTNGSNGWHNHFCVEEQTMAGSGVTFKAGTETGYIYYGSSTGNPWVGSGSFGFATTATGNSSDIKMVLKKNGNVGIGTLSPDAKLEVSGDLNIAATSDGWNTSVGKGLYLRFYDGHDIGYIQCIDRSNSDKQYKLKYMASHHEFSTRASGETSDPIRMVINGSGNVGIGTATPRCLLNTNNNLANTENTIPTGVGTINATTSLFLGKSSNNATSGSYHNYWGLIMGTLWNGNSYIYSGDANNSTYYNLLLNPLGGKVGIGTASPEHHFQVAEVGTGNNTNLSDAIASIVSNSEPEYGRYGMYFGTHQSNGWSWIQTGRSGSATSSSATMGPQYSLCLQPSAGNVGIGMTDPLSKLQVNGRVGCGGWSSDGNNSMFCIANDTNWGMKFIHSGSQYFTRFGCYGTGDNNRGFQFYDHGYSSVRMFIAGNGLTGIATTSPTGGLHVANYYDHGTGQVGNYFLNQNSYAHSSSSWMHSSNSNGRIYVGIRCNYGIWALQLNYDSDSRIKTEITDLSDNRALELLRNIPCREYHYKDIKKREKDKTIGFIAQEVNEILPNAVSIQPNIIPNEMRMLENISWEEIIDGSNNIYKLTTDLQDVSGVKYRFYVSNDPSGNDECNKEIVGNQDNTFSFDSSYNNVFCYGREVEDYHTLNKDKLFALNFSATQELDRQQQADKLRIAELEQEVNELKTIVHALKNHLGLS